MKGTAHPRSRSPRGMATIGLDIGETNKRNLAQRRIKGGKCPTCGVRTHKIGMFGKKMPLTVKGECVQGRCLRCQPVEGYLVRPSPPVQVATQLPQPDMGVGRDIIVEDDDSVVSGITMDPALKGAPTRWTPGTTQPMHDLEEENDVPPPVIRKPAPSICDDGDLPPHRNRRPDEPQEWMDSIGKFEATGQSGRSRRTSPPSSSQPHSKPIDIAPPPNPPRRPDAPSRRISAHYTNVLATRVPSDIEEEGSSAQKMSDVSSGQRKSSSSDLSFPAIVTDSNEEEHARLDGSLPNGHGMQISDEEEKNEIQAPRESLRDQSWRNQDPNLIMNETRDSRKDLRQRQRRTSGELAEISFVPDGQQDGRGSVRQTSSSGQRPIRQPSGDRVHKPTKLSPQSADLQFIPDSEDHVPIRRPPPQPPSAHAKHGRKRLSMPRETERRASSPPRHLHPTNHRQPGSPRREIGQPRSYTASSDVASIPLIMPKLVSREADSKRRCEAFQELAALVWHNGDEAKVAVQNNRGIESIVESMWEDLGDPDVQTAAVHLLFALSACSEESMGRDVFLKGRGNAIDALLISMQTHISVESLQTSGCGALGCLASASSENERVDDGTLSGAVSCVVAAMDAHRKSAEIQKWGLWALYCQCVLSYSAEANQMNLAKGATEAGGMNVILRAMEVNESDLVALGWACRLYWSLSFSDEIVGILTESNRTIVAIVKVLRFYQGNAESEIMEEAAFGALANIARVKRSHNWLRECGIVARVFESMDAYRSVEGVNIEACALLANLAETQLLKDAVLRYGVDRIFRALKTFPDSVELHDEALRALLSLSVDSEEAKTVLSTGENLKLVIDAVVHHQRSTSLLETGFALIASLRIAKSSRRTDLRDIVQLLVKAMLQLADERKLQESACLLLRNLSCRDELVVESDDFFSAVLNVMKRQADCQSVQLNLCCTLSNLLAKEEGIVCCKVDDGLNQIVAVIQSNMESADVLEMACSALWNLIASSEQCKQGLVESGGVEYVKTVLLMHPESPRTLEKACGVLSCLSGSPSHAGLVAESQGISFVVETMRAHATSLVLLEYASLMLRNLVLNNVENATEASGGISTIVTALKDNPDATAFQIEACNALWVMAAQSEDCRQKILALDGQIVLMELMNDTNMDVEVREVAHRTFNQLEIPSSY